MDELKFIIGTGFFHKPDEEEKASSFFETWYDNTIKHSSPKGIVVLANGGCSIHGARGQWISMDGNLGHAHDLSNHIKPHEMCGWSASIVALAMIAYSNETDLIYKEQDCLAFGPWPERMYDEIGNRGMIFGHNRVFPCSQSLFLIKHAFIPEFVRLYMAEGSEQSKSNECELKFDRMEKAHRDKFCRFSFPYDRDRPLSYDLDVWYAQQIKPEELQWMKMRGLI